jgi:hypothetical protein
VALLLLEGYSHKAIAKHKGRSPQTVRQHPAVVYRKGVAPGVTILARGWLVPGGDGRDRVAEVDGPDRAGRGHDPRYQTPSPVPHLYLDPDLGDLTAPIPTVPGSFVHMGDAATEHTFENVSSGPHRLIAVVADGAHLALQPLVVDTVEFVVE